MLVAAHRIFHCAVWASLQLCVVSLLVAPRHRCPVACGIWVPQLWIKPVSRVLEGEFFTTGPPGKSKLRSFQEVCKTCIKWRHLASLVIKSFLLSLSNTCSNCFDDHSSDFHLWPRHCSQDQESYHGERHLPSEVGLGPKVSKWDWACALCSIVFCFVEYSSSSWYAFTAMCWHCAGLWEVGAGWKCASLGPDDI